MEQIISTENVQTIYKNQIKILELEVQFEFFKSLDESHSRLKTLKERSENCISV